MDGGFLCVLTAFMREWREMQFSQIFAETESKMLKVILGREKLLIKETEAHFDRGKVEFHMNLLSAAGAGLQLRESKSSWSREG